MWQLKRKHLSTVHPSSLSCGRMVLCGPQVALRPCDPIPGCCAGLCCQHLSCTDDDFRASLESSNQVNRSGRQFLHRQCARHQGLSELSPPNKQWKIPCPVLWRKLVTSSVCSVCQSFPEILTNKLFHVSGAALHLLHWEFSTLGFFWGVLAGWSGVLSCVMHCLFPAI